MTAFKIYRAIVHRSVNISLSEVILTRYKPDATWSSVSSVSILLSVVGVIVE